MKLSIIPILSIMLVSICWVSAQTSPPDQILNKTLEIKDWQYYPYREYLQYDSIQDYKSVKLIDAHGITRLDSIINDLADFKSQMFFMNFFESNDTVWFYAQDWAFRSLSNIVGHKNRIMYLKDKPTEIFLLNSLDDNSSQFLNDITNGNNDSIRIYLKKEYLPRGYFQSTSISKIVCGYITNDTANVIFYTESKKGRGVINDTLKMPVYNQKYNKAIEQFEFKALSNGESDR